MRFEMVDGRCVEVRSGRIVVAFANPDYEAAEPYQVFDQEMPEKGICSCYAFDTPEDFVNKWYEMVENPEGMWYWVLDEGVCICSGACDPGDIEAFKEHWELEGEKEDINDFFKEVEVAPEHVQLSEKNREKARNILKKSTYDDMSKSGMKLVIAYELEQYKMKVDKLFEKGWSGARIEDKVHEWWSDYRMADGTEDALLAYVEKQAKKIAMVKAYENGPLAVESMRQFKEDAVAEMAEGYDSAQGKLVLTHGGGGSTAEIVGARHEMSKEDKQNSNGDVKVSVASYSPLSVDDLVADAGSRVQEGKREPEVDELVK